jgi:hypothetical protein
MDYSVFKKQRPPDGGASQNRESIATISKSYFHYRHEKPEVKLKSKCAALGRKSGAKRAEETVFIAGRGLSKRGSGSSLGYSPGAFQAQATH